MKVKEKSSKKKPQINGAIYKALSSSQGTSDVVARGSLP